MAWMTYMTVIFVVYGMGGFFTGTTKDPLTGIVLVTELTGSMNQLMPISIVCLSAYVISDILKLEQTDEIALFNKTRHYPTEFEGKLAQMEISVNFDEELDDLSMSHLILPYNAKVVKIIRNEHGFLPHKNITLLPGDRLDIACDAGFIKEVSSFLEEANGT